MPPMLRAGPLAVFGLAACAGAPTPAPPAAAPAASAPAASAVRLFHAAGEPDFWVDHAADRDLVVSSGARLETDAAGEISAAAWSLDLARRGDAITGGLAVPARLGGGFVFWTRARVFRAASFTGALEPVAFDVEGAVIRGARSGLASVLVFTDAGPRELVAGSTRLRPLADPGVLDAAAISDRRAARLDLFGHLAATDDGGRTFADLSPAVGLAARNLVVGDSDLFADTGDARLVLRAGGRLDPAEAAGRPNRDAAKLFQIAWKGTRAADRTELPWGVGATSPLGAAVASGGAVGDGTAFGVIQGNAVRVDLRTGQLIEIGGEWMPSGVTCQPVRAPDALLFACVWDRYQGYGGYVLRSVNGGPPEIEKAFSDDGLYVADDEGALGFLGSCHAEPRWIDADDTSRLLDTGGDPAVSPVICVRRGPGDWVERRADVGDDATLVAWVAGKDGRAVALATANDPLPPPASPGRVTDRAGVRVIVVDRDLQGWSFGRAGVNERTGTSGYVDRRYHLRADGTIDAWLSPVQDAYPPVAVGAVLDPRGLVTVRAAAPGMTATATGSAFGLAVSSDGSLYESADFGRTWRPAGPSPVPASAFGSASCSALGCTLGSVVRLGWGEGLVGPRVLADPIPLPPRPPPSRKLVCAPAGPPVPLVAPPLPPGARTTVTTPWGDTLDLVRDASAPDPAPPSAPSGLAPAVVPPSAVVPPAVARPAPSAAPAARPPASKKPPRPSPAVLRTHTLLVRPPFAPRAAVRRLNATDASLEVSRRSLVIPLLGAGGDVELIVVGDTGEILVSGDRITPLPSTEAPRSMRGHLRDGNNVPAGLSAAAGHALVLGEVRRRLFLEDHGPGAPTIPVVVGADVDEHRHRPLTLARRDDGTPAVLVLDGPAPETVGAATFDRAAATAGPVTRLATWSTAVTADAPACKPGADPGAFRAIVLIDPAAWLAVDPAALPGITLGHQGMMLVRWDRERVCVEALEASVPETRARGGSGRTWSLVARWGGEGERGAALRAADVRQDLVCRME